MQRNHGCWQWHHRFPYLVAAVAVMEHLPGWHRWLRPASRLISRRFSSVPARVGGLASRRSPGHEGERALASTEPHERRDASWSQGCRLGLSARICLEVKPRGLSRRYCVRQHNLTHATCAQEAPHTRNDIHRYRLPRLSTNREAMLCTQHDTQFAPGERESRDSHAEHRLARDSHHGPMLGRILEERRRGSAAGLSAAAAG